MSMQPVHVLFLTQYDSGEAKDNLYLDSGPGGVMGQGLVTYYPPSVGDDLFLVHTTDESGRKAATYRVSKREWMHPQYGSQHWPRGELQPTTGPTLNCVVEEVPE